MQTLTAGSFLNLENAENVEALKFTARRLAEHTTAVVAENLNAEALKNLADDLWQKAEYVARETERRRLHEIFVENFCEKFRELKPEIAPAEITNVEARQNISAVGNDDSTTTQQLSETVESVSMPDLPQDDTTAAEEKRDEFLGFVKNDEPFVGSLATETNAAATAAMPPAPEKTERETIEAAPDAGEKVSTETPNEIKPQATAVAAPVADAKDNAPSPATSAVKNTAPAPKSADVAKEPFEFGKCTVNLNLTLLPASGDGRGGRRAIISAASHGLPPEIEFLEIGDGDNLTEIVALVSGKLERFKQTLPAKYIEQLRATKSKTAKKPTTAKPAVAPAPAPTKPEITQANGAKTGGEQQTQNLSATETEKPKTEITATKETSAAQTAPVAPLPQSQIAAANNAQPSLF